jgi:hypothetical protein
LLGDAFGGGAAAEGAARAVLIVESPPLFKLGGEVGILRVDGGPELLKCGALSPLDLAIEVRCAGSVGSELDLLLAEVVLELVGEALMATIGLPRAAWA